MKKIPRIHLILFFLTFVSMVVAGLPADVNLLENPWRIYEGVPFATTLMLILMAHEFAHYFTSMKHHTAATLPYFLPAPPIISPVGTFGAFIKMKSPILTRRALIDIGASGPIASFVLSVLAWSIGLQYSTVVPLSEPQGLVVTFNDSILTLILTKVIIGNIPDGYTILSHPLVFAGWFGLFVTSLNLIPVGQLDGGHIVYAFLKERHGLFSRVLAMLFIGMGIFGILQVLGEKNPLHIETPLNHLGNLPQFWPGWAVWGGILLILGLRHPPVMHWEVPLDGTRRLIGALALIIFIVTFMPVPITILE